MLVPGRTWGQPVWEEVAHQAWNVPQSGSAACGYERRPRPGALSCRYSITGICFFLREPKWSRGASY